MKIYAILSALIWLAVTLISHGYLGTKGFFYDLPNGQMPFGIFLILYILSFIFYLIIITKITWLSVCRHNIFIIIAGAVVFRLILLPSIPIHENDIYRYIWDGRVFNAGINPYKYAPIQASIKPVDEEIRNTPPHMPISSFPGSTGESSSFQHRKGLNVRSNTFSTGHTSQENISDFEKLKFLRDKDPKSYRRISFKEVSTIYPPLAQVIFALAALIAPGSILFMKFIFVFFDIGVIILLLMILKIYRQNPLYSLIYAWNPLVLKEFANSGHYDAIAICCVMAAVYLIKKDKYSFSSLLMGLGVLARFYPLIFLPFYLLKKQYKAFFIGLAAIAAGYLPFCIWGSTDLKTVFTGLGIYALEWANNGFIFSIIRAVFIDNPVILSKIICGGIFTAVWIFILYKRQDLTEKIFAAVAALFLLSPAGFPWYFCWVIPFLCIYRRYSLIGLSFLLILHYFVFTRDFGQLSIAGFKIDNLQVMQYVPFYIFLFFEMRFNTCILKK